MELKGQIFEIFSEKVITEKFTIRDFVLKVANGKYSEYILFQCANQQVKLLDSFMEGEMVTVDFTIGGRKSKDRYWNSLKVSKITAQGELKREPPKNIQEQTNYPEFADTGKPPQETHPLPAEESDLPF